MSDEKIPPHVEQWYRDRLDRSGIQAVICEECDQKVPYKEAHSLLQTDPDPSYHWCYYCPACWAAREQAEPTAEADAPRGAHEPLKFLCPLSEITAAGLARRLDLLISDAIIGFQHPDLDHLGFEALNNAAKIAGELRTRLQREKE